MRNVCGKFLLVLVASLMSNQMVSVAKAARGRSALDAGFGTRGRVTTDFAGSADRAFSIAVQPDGKVVAAGVVLINGEADFALARYNGDGTLDAGFGTGGRVITDFAGLDDVAFSVAVQPDGKIIAAGLALVSGEGDFALARYNSDGTLDAGFGTGGRVTTDFAVTNDQANSVVLQPDGKIVATGQTNIDGGLDFALARYNSDGTLDAGFGTGGKVTTKFVTGTADEAFSVAQAFSVALQPDGKLVAAGQAFISDDFHFALARYNSDGTLDAAFGTGGEVTTNFAGSTDRARSVAVQADGKIVAAGVANTRGGFDFALARYNGDGTLDASFGTGGTLTTDFRGSSDVAFAVVLEPDGTIVAAGQSTNSRRGDFALARYNTDGTLDARFGRRGRVVTDFARSTDQAFAIALQPDGKIVAAGLAEINRRAHFALARYR